MIKRAWSFIKKHVRLTGKAPTEKGASGRRGESRLGLLFRFKW